MQFQITDTHNHSVTFSDGSLTPEQIVQKAKEKGYQVGIADHFSRFHKIKTDEHLERYISYLDTLPCYKAGELDLGQETMFAGELLNRLDYIIGNGWGQLLTSDIFLDTQDGVGFLLGSWPERYASSLRTPLITARPAPASLARGDQLRRRPEGLTVRTLRFRAQELTSALIPNEEMSDVRS